MYTKALYSLIFSHKVKLKAVNEFSSANVLTKKEAKSFEVIRLGYSWRKLFNNIYLNIY